MKSRTKARGFALQVLYELDQSIHPAGTIIQNLSEEFPLEENLTDFAVSIINGVIPIRSKLDEAIAKFAPDWPIDQVAIIDRNILRIALWELCFESGTPVKVVINESIELGKSFGSDSTPRFVNGVMGSLVDNLNSIKQIIH